MNRVEIRRRQIQIGSTGLELIILWILGRRIGDNGIAYLAVPLECFLVICALGAKQIPDVMGKILRSRMARGQYKNAVRLRQCVGLFQCIIGILVTVLFFVAADFLSVQVFRISYSKSLILLLSPLVLLRTVNSVLLGIYQGEGNELPSAVSSVLRPLLILGFGLLFSRMLSGYGEKVSHLLGQEAFQAMYGGMGIGLAILLAEILVMLFLAMLYKGVTKERRKKQTESMRTIDPVASQIKAVYGSIGLPVLAALLELLPLLAGLILYQGAAADHTTSAVHYGLFFGKYLVICGIPCCILMIFLFPLAVKIADRQKPEESRITKTLFQSSMKSCMAYGMFLSIYFTVMSEQIAGTFSRTHVGTVAEMLQKGSFLLVLLLFGVLGLQLIENLGKGSLRVICLAGADLIFFISLSVMFKKGGANIVYLIYAGLISAAVLVVVVMIMLFRFLKCRFEPVRMLAIPLGSACVAGFISYLLAKVLTPHLGMGITAILTFCISFLACWMINMGLRLFTNQELNTVPGGMVLRAIGQLMRIY